MMISQSQDQKMQSSTAENKPIFSLSMLDHCERKYRKLIKKDKVLHKVTETFLEELQTNPHVGEKLEVNFPGLRSIHYFGNKYRIIYKVLVETYQIVVYEIDHRKSSYADLAKALGQGK
jgi:mRNA-degrading endonuclease RelE of RelBE toxin-antitoxin system